MNKKRNSTEESSGSRDYRSKEYFNKKNDDEILMLKGNLSKNKKDKIQQLYQKSFSSKKEKIELKAIEQCKKNQEEKLKQKNHNDLVVSYASKITSIDQINQVKSQKSSGIVKNNLNDKIRFKIKKKDKYNGTQDYKMETNAV